MFCECTVLFNTIQSHIYDFLHTLTSTYPPDSEKYKLDIEEANMFASMLEPMLALDKVSTVMVIGIVLCACFLVVILHADFLSWL